MDLSTIIGFPTKPEEPKGPPMGFFRITTKVNPDGRMHYGYLIVTSTFLGITDDDSNLVYAVPLDQLIEVERKSVDAGDGVVH